MAPRPSAAELRLRFISSLCWTGPLFATVSYTGTFAQTVTGQRKCRGLPSTQAAICPQMMLHICFPGLHASSCCGQNSGLLPFDAALPASVARMLPPVRMIERSSPLSRGAVQTRSTNLQLHVLSMATVNSPRDSTPALMSCCAKDQSGKLRKASPHRNAPLTGKLRRASQNVNKAAFRLRSEGCHGNGYPLLPYSYRNVRVLVNVARLLTYLLLNCCPGLTLTGLP